MRITAIKSYPLWIGSRNQLVVKIDTDEGLSGMGESGLSGRERAVMGAIDHFREWLIGRDPFQRGRLWQEMYRSQYFEGGRVLLAAQSAIDLALHDIVGQALGVPVYQLLGGRQRDVVPCFASAAGSTVEELVANVQALWHDGWKCIRAFPLPGQNFGDIYDARATIAPTVEALIQARAAIGPALTLGLDYHHRLSLGEAASFCQHLPPGTLDFLEEPIRDETPAAYAALRRLSPIPFAIGEEFASKWQFLPYLEQHLTDYARLDLCNVGGFTEAIKVTGWAEAHYIALMPHNPLGPVCTAATIHFAAAVPNFAWLEAQARPRSQTPPPPAPDPADDFFPVRPRLDGTGFRVDDTPGLGLVFDEKRAQAETWKFWEPPHWQRADGAVTNW